MIENEQFVSSPELTVDRLVEGADTLVAIGNGESRHVSCRLHRFAFCDVFTFAGEAIGRVESYVVSLNSAG